MATVKKCPHCELLIGAALVQETVVVIPTADWARLVELVERLPVIGCDASDRDLSEIDDIIKKVQP